MKTSALTVDLGPPIQSSGAPWRSRFLRRTTSRVRTALAGMALLSGLLALPSLYPLLVALALALAFFAAREYAHMAAEAGLAVPRVLLPLAAVACAAIGLLQPSDFGRALVPAASLSLMGFFMIHMRRRGFAESFRLVPASFFGPFYIGVPLAMALQLAQADRMFFLFGLLAVWMADTGGYVAGRFFGRTKLAPRLSPKKTVEGLVGGVALSVAVGAVYKSAAPPMAFPYSWTVSLLIPASLAILGPIGDLAESALKRDAGVKDSGSTGTGHGGVLDRIDSLLFCLVVLYAYLVLIGRL